ncbi:dihydrodipicolinate synthase family protein [Mediterraneibacter sp. ICN-202921]|uniref:dihydrodipicolinate synthase family protein n=1 Tax=Mediterraneibacter sp. ICN-202921 TaxID=3134657 RepID=UPI0030BE5820
MQGIYTAIVTAFQDNGEIDEKGTRSVIRHSIDHCKADGILVGGTMGERYKMSTESMKRLLEVAAAEINGKVDMVANISAISREEVLELGTAAAANGYATATLIAPIFHKYSEEEIKQYYYDIADHSKLPLMIYVIPSFSGVNFTENMLETLLEHPNIIGMKFTHNDYYLLDRIRVKKPEATLFTGFDDILLQALIMGTNGAIGGTFNLTGVFAKKLYGAACRKEYEMALKYQRNINDVEDMLNETGLFPTIKATLQVMGIPCGELKAPSMPITERQREQGKKILDYLERNGG